jgi:hypothetical protein
MSDKEIDQYHTEWFEDLFDHYEHATYSGLDRENIDTGLSKEELLEQAKRIAVEGPPETKEEQIAFLNSHLRQLAKDDPEAYIVERYNTVQRDISKRLNPYEKHERKPFIPIFREIREFSADQIDLIKEWLEEFNESEDGKALSQHYHQLIEIERGDNRKVSVTDGESAAYAVDIYKEAMNVCDDSTPIPVAYNYVSKGTDPKSKNLINMGFARRLQALEGTVYEPIANHIDIDLRHAVKHGDYYVDASEECLSADGGERVYSFAKLEDTVNRALLATDVVSASDGYISLTTYRRTFDFLN